MAKAEKKDPALTPEEKLAQALVPESKQPYPVPENWCWIQLGAISENQYGFTAKAIFDNSLPKMLRITDIQENGVDWDSVPNCAINTEDKKKYLLSDNDIVIARTGATTGKSYLLTNPVNAVFASYLIRLRVNNRIVPAYIYLFFQSELYWKQISEMSSGIAQPGVNSSKLQTLIFPISPFSEQQRIVDRIESLFAKLDEAKEKAQAVVDGFEDRKAAILHRAFTGELTAEWRREHHLEFDWCTRPWDDFLISIEAGKNWNAEGRPPEGEEFGVVKVSSVTWGEFDEQESKTCTLKDQWNDKTQINLGDFLFSRANTLQLVGNCVIVKHIEKRLMLSDKILRLSFDSSVEPYYILYFTRSDLYRQQIEELASGNQDGMRNVSQKNMKLVLFPIPSIPEQTEIVHIIGKLQVKELQAKKAAEQVINQIDVIKKSILARAFRGELGTNDPADESAEELLKRIL